MLNIIPQSAGEGPDDILRFVYNDLYTESIAGHAADADPNTLDPLDMLVLGAQQWMPQSQQVKWALDLGCGVGQHATWFAQCGFKVDAIDISDVAISWLQGWSDTHGAPIHPQVGNINQLDLKRKYSVMMLRYVLQHATQGTAQGLVKYLQGRTYSGGVHVLRLHGPNSSLADFIRNTGQSWSFFDERLIRRLYANWRILHWREAIELMPMGPYKTSTQCFEVIVQKP